MLSRLQFKVKPAHAEGEPPPTPEEVAAERDIILAELALEVAEDTTYLIRLARDWQLAPGVALQIAAESIRPGQTIGERILELWYGEE